VNLVWWLLKGRSGVAGRGGGGGFAVVFGAVHPWEGLRCMVVLEEHHSPLPILLRGSGGVDILITSCD
jgi:hypothetical protein